MLEVVINLKHIDMNSFTNSVLLDLQVAKILFINFNFFLLSLKVSKRKTVIRMCQWPGGGGDGNVATNYMVKHARPRG